MRSLSPRLITALFLVNVGLQLCDGLLTYQGLQLGFHEGNPLVMTAIDQWGAGWGLLFWKAEACGLLVFLWHLAEYPLAVFGLVMTAGSYLVLSVIPWTGLLLFA